MSVSPTQTKISLGIRPVWSESSLCAQCVAKDPSFLYADSEDPGQTGLMPRLIWFSLGAHAFCWFCHVAAHFTFVSAPKTTSVCIIHHPRQEYYAICTGIRATTVFEPQPVKPTIWPVRPAKTQISLGICPVWSASSLSSWRSLGSLNIHWAHSENSDLSGRMPRLICVFAGRTGHFVGFVMLRLQFGTQDYIGILLITVTRAKKLFPSVIHHSQILYIRYIQYNSLGNSCSWSSDPEILVSSPKIVINGWPQGSELNGPRQANLVLITYASSEGSGEPAHPRSLARTFAARSYKQWVKRNLQTESQIPGPSEWLGMRS